MNAQYRTIRVHRRVPLVARDGVVEIFARIGPVPLADDDIPLETLGTRRRLPRQLSRRDPVGPIGERGQHAFLAEPVEVGVHVSAAVDARPQPAVPRRRRGIERAQTRRHLARRLVAHLVARRARAGLDVVDPVGLAPHRFRDAIALGPGAGELTLVRDTEHGVPIIRRVVVRRRFGIRRHNGRQIQNLARDALRARRIDQPVSPHEHAVVGLRQVGHDIPATIVGDDGLDQPRRQVGRFSRDPHSRFGSLAARHHTADVVAVDPDRAAVLRDGPSVRDSQEHCEATHEHSQRKHFLRRHGVCDLLPIASYRR